MGMKFNLKALGGQGRKICRSIARHTHYSVKLGLCGAAIANCCEWIYRKLPQVRWSDLLSGQAISPSGAALCSRNRFKSQIPKGTTSRRKFCRQQFASFKRLDSRKTRFQSCSNRSRANEPAGRFGLSRCDGPWLKPTPPPAPAPAAQSSASPPRERDVARRTPASSSIAPARCRSIFPGVVRSRS